MKNYQLQWKTEKGGRSVSWNIEQARSYDDDDDDNDDETFKVEDNRNNNEQQRGLGKF